MPAIHDAAQLRARSFVETLTRGLLAETARKRQGTGRSEGARAPAALGQPRRVLAAVSAPIGPLTPLGYKTAVRALPPVLASLDPMDPRRRAADMIDMAVRDPDLVDRDAGLLDSGEDLRNVPARIDHDSMHGRGVPQQGAVLLKGGDRHDQGASLCWFLGGLLRFICHAATMLIFCAAPSGFRAGAGLRWQVRVSLCGQATRRFGCPAMAGPAISNGSGRPTP